jgi:hypothetical protein
MTTEQSHFYKGAAGFIRMSDELRPEDIETGIYYRWWRLMRLSQLYWYADSAKVPIEDTDAASAYKFVGDLKKRSFQVWWSATGKKVFAEPIRPRKVRVLDLEQPEDLNLYEKSVVVEIPLTVSKRKIFSELREIVNSHYVNEVNPSRRVNVASFSLADLKLHTKRYHPKTIDNEYFALLYRILYPEIRQWVIADRLRLVPNITIRATDSRDWQSEADSESKNYLLAVVGRYLYKARFSRYHLERGTFPKYDKVDIDAAMPFGKARNEHFKQITKEGKVEDGSSPSEWQKWVRKEHWSAFKEHIIEKNGLERRHDIKAKDFDDRFESYLRGEINL